MVAIYKRGRIWWIRYQLDGQEIRHSLRTQAKATALREKKRIDSMIYLGQIRAIGLTPIKDVAKSFLEHQERMRRKSTVRSQRRQIDDFMEHCPVAKIGQVEPRHVTAWLDSLDVAPPTRNKARASLHRMFQWAMQEGGLAESNPVARTGRARERVRVHTFLSTEERDRLL